MLKQTLFLILSFSIIHTSVHSKLKKYRCADELKQKGFCYLESTNSTTELTTAYVKKCGKGEKCKEPDELNGNSIGWCYKSIVNNLGDEGEECKVNEECISENCVDGKCKCLNDGEECKNNHQCKSTSYCSNDKCKAYSKPGEKCDGECINGYLCGKSGSDTESKCIAKYSIEDGIAVTDTDLCKSGQSDDNKKCITYTLTSKDCDSSGECSYTTKDGKIKKFDYCSEKSDGETESCLELNGDLWDKFVTAYTKRLNKIKDDKDYNRYSSKWNEYLGDSAVSDALIEWQYNVLFSDASDCVKDYFKQYASSNFMFFNLMVIVSFALILL